MWGCIWHAIVDKLEASDTFGAYTEKLFLGTPFLQIFQTKTFHIGHIQKNLPTIPRNFDKTGYQTIKILYMPFYAVLQAYVG